MVDRKAQELIEKLTTRNKELEANATYIGFLQFRLQLLIFINSLVQGSKDIDDARTKLKALNELVDEFELSTLEKTIKRPHCKNCGTVISGRERFCPSCGAPTA